MDGEDGLPDIYDACALAEYFSVSIDYLLGCSDDSLSKNQLNSNVCPKVVNDCVAQSCADPSAFNEILRSLRTEKGYSQRALAEMLNVSQQLIAKYEAGTSTPSPKTIAQIAALFGVSADYLVGSTVSKEPKPLASNIFSMPKMVKKPLLGTIACGQQILATESVNEYVDVPENIHCDFAVRCKGDSMIDARIYDGDAVYIQQQEEVENGQIAAVLIEGECETEATLKRVYLSSDSITLVPENRSYAPLVFTGNAMNRVHIIGRAVAFTSRMR